MQQAQEQITMQSSEYMISIKSRRETIGKLEYPTTVAELQQMHNELKEELAWIHNNQSLNETTKKHLLCVLDSTWHQLRHYGIDNLGFSLGSFYK